MVAVMLLAPFPFLPMLLRLLLPFTLFTLLSGFALLGLERIQRQDIR